MDRSHQLETIKAEGSVILEQQCPECISVLYKMDRFKVEVNYDPVTHLAKSAKAFNSASPGKSEPLFYK